MDAFVSTPSAAARQPLAGDVAHKRRRRRRIALVLVVVLAGAWSWHCGRQNLKRLSVVRPGVLLRVGQPTEAGLRRLVWHDHVRTVLSTQLHEVRLYRSAIDLGQPDGQLESVYVRSLGAQHLQWPLGEEACWPWPSPWVLEAFLKLMDDPAQWPVALHCQGGRHRTGTLAAIFRLEYDRWPVERVLEEMHSFDFGVPVAIQEHNLRTYLPRPLPTLGEWISLSARLGSLIPPAERTDYLALVRALRRRRFQSEIESRLDELLAELSPVAVCLAQRLIDTIDDPLTVAATAAAERVLDADETSSGARAMAAALVADFGDEAAQARLARRLADAPLDQPVDEHYAALAAGVLNRYTRNRTAFWQILLRDTRRWPGADAAGARLADSAVARLSVALNQNLLGTYAPHERWEQGRLAALAWTDEHRGQIRLARLEPPDRPRAVQSERHGRHQEDLSRLR